MAHFAEIDDSYIVTRVVVTDNNDPAGDDGYQWLIDNLGGRWIRTSYNANIRKNFAGIGFTYDPHRDAFIPPKPFASWVLDEETCQWAAPITKPETGGPYNWSEATLQWIEVPSPI